MYFIRVLSHLKDVLKVWWWHNTFVELQYLGSARIACSDHEDVHCIRKKKEKSKAAELSCTLLAQNKSSWAIKSCRKRQQPQSSSSTLNNRAGWSFDLKIQVNSDSIKSSLWITSLNWIVKSTQCMKLNQVPLKWSERSVDFHACVDTLFSSNLIKLNHTFQSDRGWIPHLWFISGHSYELGALINWWASPPVGWVALNFYWAEKEIPSKLISKYINTYWGMQI